MVWRWRVGALAVDELMVHGIVLHLRIYPAFARVSKIVGLVRVVYIFQYHRQKNHTFPDEIEHESFYSRGPR